MCWKKCFPFEIYTYTDGTRAKGRRSNCSREISFILEGTPPLSPWVILDTNQVTDHCVTVINNIMCEHNVWFLGQCLLLLVRTHSAHHASHGVDAINYGTKYTSKVKATLFYCDQINLNEPVRKQGTPEEQHINNQ